MKRSLVAALALGVLSGLASAQTTPEAEEAIQQGAVIYSTLCVACHQAAGQGVEGAFPALAGNEFVLGDPAEVVKLPLYGRGGMPNFGGELSDEEIAAVVSYIRNSWGNEAGVVEPGLVTRVRSGEVEEAPADPNARPGAAN